MAVRVRRGSVSEYLLQLQEKQKARFSYGLTERQFRNIFAEASRRQGVTGENMLRFLELRLDNVIYRTGWAATRPQARQFVGHGHVNVNGRRADIPSYRLRKGDVVELRPAAQDFTVVQWNLTSWIARPRRGSIATSSSRSLCASCPSVSRSTSPSVNSSSSSSTRSSRGTDARHPATHCRSHRRGGGNLQRFAVGPLEPGFGHTIGNSLRRTLLSSIPGAAVTQVRFDDALHEFDTIEGVAQDVTDIILNLKDLVLVVHSDEPVTLRLDARGAAEVTAADIQPHPDVEVLNGALEIASLNGKGRLAVDLTVQNGRGYVSADKNKTSTTIGVIPVDSIYSPVRRVSFEVEPTRAEQSTDYDRLVLEIETDGSISLAKHLRRPAAPCVPWCSSSRR